MVVPVLDLAGILPIDKAVGGHTVRGSDTPCHLQSTETCCTVWIRRSLSIRLAWLVRIVKTKTPYLLSYGIYLGTTSTRSTAATSTVPLLLLLPLLFRESSTGYRNRTGTAFIRTVVLIATQLNSTQHHTVTQWQNHHHYHLQEQDRQSL
jgi:hypothetical protein